MMNHKFDIADGLYRSACFRYWTGIATPRDFEDIVCLTMDASTPQPVWDQAFRLRTLMMEAGIPFLKEVPEVVSEK